jgi:hypothetical protein
MKNLLRSAHFVKEIEGWFEQIWALTALFRGRYGSNRTVTACASANRLSDRKDSTRLCKRNTVNDYELIWTKLGPELAFGLSAPESHREGFTWPWRKRFIMRPIPIEPPTK